ncbi:hypothetical protein GOBAR_AA28722 [Gossypium barbadense]|uniref:Uncharacterized protein n=1 Tax=Gossypium barbadense TaxID=3634 RepID=A0A2P5WLJ8_GOSBA|nr:hypothetical protein GOBAR_AA28722 [Gossypium barbadense]
MKNMLNTSFVSVVLPNKSCKHTKWHRKEKGSTLRCFGSRKHQKEWKEYQLWTEGEWAEKKFREYLSKIMKNVSLDEMKTQRIRRERPEQDYRKQSYQKYRSTPATNTDEETKGKKEGG